MTESAEKVNYWGSTLKFHLINNGQSLHKTIKCCLQLSTIKVNEKIKQYSSTNNKVKGS